MIQCDRCVPGEHGERIDVRLPGQAPCAHVARAPVTYPRTVDELIMILLTLPPEAGLTASEVSHDSMGAGRLTVTVIYPYPIPPEGRP